MFFVYLILSEKTGRFYVGQTNHLEYRLKRHNSGIVKSTRFGIPWKTVHTIEVGNRTRAIILENSIKKRGAKRYIEDLQYNQSMLSLNKVCL